MLCYKCKNALNCNVFRTLYSKSKDFYINECTDYDELPDRTYRKIAEHDDLMRLIYDYFTDQVDGDYTEEKIVASIRSAMLNL